MTNEQKNPNPMTQPHDVRSRPDAGRGNDDRSSSRTSSPKVTDPKLPELTDNPDDTTKKIDPQGAATAESGRNPSLERKGSDSSRSRHDENRGGGKSEDSGNRPKGDTSRTGSQHDERGQSGSATKQAPKFDTGGTAKKTDMTPNRDSGHR
jgi:hypothetical protein